MSPVLQYGLTRPAPHRVQNPLAGLSQSIESGFRMGQEARKNRPSTIALDKPQEMKPATYSDTAKKDSDSLEAYKEVYKKTKDMSLADRDAAYKEALKSGKITSPIVFEAMKMNISPDKVEPAINKMLHDDPEARFELKVLQSKFRPKSEGWQQVEDKNKYVTQENVRRVNQRADQLYSTLIDIVRVLEDPKAYEGRGGVNPQTAEVLSKNKEYRAELQMIAPDKFAEFMKEAKNIRATSGGGRKGYKGESRLGYINMLERRFEKSRWIDQKTKKQTKQMINELSKRSGPMTQRDHDIMARIEGNLGKKGGTVKDKKGRTYTVGQIVNIGGVRHRVGDAGRGRAKFVELRVGEER